MVTSKEGVNPEEIKSRLANFDAETITRMLSAAGTDLSVLSTQLDKKAMLTSFDRIKTVIENLEKVTKATKYEDYSLPMSADAKQLAQSKAAAERNKAKREECTKRCQEIEDVFDEQHEILFLKLRGVMDVELEHLELVENDIKAIEKRMAASDEEAAEMKGWVKEANKFFRT